MADAKRSVVIRLSLEQAQQLKSQLREVGEAGERSMGQIKSGAERASQALAAINVAAQALAVGATAVLALRQLVQAGDALTTSMFRLNNAIGSVAGAAAVYEQLYRSSLQTGVAVNESVDAFQRFSVAARSIGATNSEVARLVTGLQAAAIVSGASAQETASGVLQLAQGLASGVLQGDELRSLLESMPLFAEELARELGVSVGQLREMGAKGELVANRTFPAAIRAAETLAKKLNDAPLTVERGFNQLSVSTTNFLGQLDQAIGASRTLGRLLGLAAEALDGVRRGVGLGTAEEDVRGRAASAQAALDAEIGRQARNSPINPLDNMLRNRRLAAARRAAFAANADLAEFELGGNQREAAEATVAAQRAAEDQRRRAQERLNPLLDRLDPSRPIQQRFDEAKAAIEEGQRTGALTALEATVRLSQAERERTQALAALNNAVQRAGGAQRARNQVDSEGADLQREITQLIQQNETATERYARRMSELGELVERAAARNIIIPDETISRATNAALEDVTRATEQTREATRQTSDTARELGLTFSSAFEDAIVRGKSLQDVIQGIGADLLRLGTRRLVTEPLVGLLDRGIASLGGGGEGGLGGIFSGLQALAGRVVSAVFHEGGMVGGPSPTRGVPALAFAGAQRYHSGGFPGLRPDEVPAILQRGERVLSRDQVRRGMGGGASIVMNITTPDASSFRASQSQILADMNRAIGRGRRGL